MNAFSSVTESGRWWVISLSRPNFGAEMAAFSLAEFLLAAQDELEAVLQEVDAAAMCQLKAVSVAWCDHARRELCNRVCCREGASITDVNVECLNEAGRPWEVVLAEVDSCRSWQAPVDTAHRPPPNPTHPQS